jgi:hypothetical protein
MTDDELREVASEWLNPLDLLMADLLDKSERMTIGAFYEEVRKAVESIPSLYGRLNHQALEEALEEEIGDAIILALDSKPNERI